MLSGMTRIRRQKVVGAGIKPLVKEGFRFVDLARRDCPSDSNCSPHGSDIGRISLTRKSRLHALSQQSQQRMFSAPLTNLANFFRA